MIRLLVYPEESAEWRAQAKKHGLPLSEYIRRRVTLRPLTARKPKSSVDVEPPGDGDFRGMTPEELAEMDREALERNKPEPKQEKSTEAAGARLSKEAEAAWLETFGMTLPEALGQEPPARPRTEFRAEKADQRPAKILDNGMILD